MSPRTLAASRRNKREAYRPPTPRAEIAKAVGAVIGVLTLTLFLLWAMRPSGLFGRQPRVVTVMVVGVIVLGCLGSYLTGPSRRFHHNQRLGWLVAFGVSVVVSLALVVVYNIWLDGVILHTPAVATVPVAPSTPVAPTTPPTNPAGATLPTVPVSPSTPTDSTPAASSTP